MNKLKIVFILNNLKREQKRAEKIRMAIVKLKPDAEVYILERRDPDFMIKVIEINPYIIVDGPYTAITTSYKPYILKYLLNSFLICHRAEGVMNCDSKIQVKLFSGLEKYGINLVDYEIFWGRQMAESLGPILLEQGKIASLDRIKYFGAPLIEACVNPDDEPRSSLPSAVVDKINQYPKHKILLFVTGFHFAEYTPQDLIVAGDIVDRDSDTADDDFKEALDAVQLLKRFRQMWVDAIIDCASKNREYLLVVKMHPQEIVVYEQKKCNPYKVFDDYENILLIDETIPFKELALHSGILFHYGSTTSFEAYLLGIPSVFIDSKDLKLINNKYIFLSDIGVDADVNVDISDLADFISNYSTNPVHFSENENVDEYLKNMFNYQKGQDYRPSEKIAEFLLSLSKEKPQSIASDDKYLINAIRQNWVGGKIIHDLMNRGISCMNQGDFQMALTRYLDKAFKLVTAGQIQVPKLNYFRSVCFANIGNIVDAIYAVRSELDLNSDEGLVQDLYRKLQNALGNQIVTQYLQPGASKVQKGQFSEALIYIDKAMELANIGHLKLNRLYYYRAICLANMGKLENALEMVNRELADNPDDNNAKTLLNELNAVLKKQEEHRQIKQLRKELDQCLPRVFAIETVLGCDLKCPECALGGDFVYRKKGWMRFDQFKIIADKIRPFCRYLYLHLWGEPLLNKDIFKMIKYASSFTATNISTNGKSLTKEKAEKLIASGVSDIIVSMDGVSQEVYKKYRVGGDVRKTKEAIKMLAHYNQKYGGKVHIMPQFIVMSHNYHEMDAFRQFCQSLGLAPLFKAPYIRQHKSMFQPSSDSKYQRPCYPDIETLKKAMSGCESVRKDFNILLDGSVVACCHDYGKITDFGNIFKQDVMAIWNSDAYREFRWNVISGNAPVFCMDYCMSYFLDSYETKNSLTDIDGFNLLLFSGPKKVDGYINIDVVNGADIVIDMDKRGLPFKDETVKVAVCGLEIYHLRRKQFVEVLKEVHRVLVPGGIARFGTHDIENLKGSLSKVGFNFIEQKQHGDSLIPGIESLDLNDSKIKYIEAVKEKECLDFNRNEFNQVLMEVQSAVATS